MDGFCKNNNNNPIVRIIINNPINDYFSKSSLYMLWNRFEILYFSETKNKEV